MRVRLVEARHFDLSLFDFDPDLTFAIVFLNPDRTIYARYGVRTDFYDSERDVSLIGLQRTMRRVLELHDSWPAERAALQGRTPSNAVPRTLGQSPWNRPVGAGIEAESCRHCHHIGHARHLQAWSERRPLTDEELFPWPTLDTLGLKLSPRHMATVVEVADDSIAAMAGLVPGDIIDRLNGQPMLSPADVQWVLHAARNTPGTAAGTMEPIVIRAEVLRGSDRLTLPLELSAGWRRTTDLSWRPTTPLLRTLALGGLTLREPPEEVRQRAGLDSDELGLIANQTVWPTLAAGRAGFQRGDLIVAVDGDRSRRTESSLIAFILQRPDPAADVVFTVFRSGRTFDIQLPAPHITAGTGEQSNRP